jgi:hypothetical protein
MAVGNMDCEILSASVGVKNLLSGRMSIMTCTTSPGDLLEAESTWTPMVGV